MVAVRPTVCVEETLTAVAVKAAVVAPAGTMAVPGTVSAELLLVRTTGTPPAGAAAVSVTVQASEAAPVRFALEHVSDCNVPAVEAPVPLRLITVVPPVAALLLIVRDPVTAPAVVGSN